MDTEYLRALRIQHKDVFIEPKLMQVFTNKYIAPQVARLLTAIHDNPEGVRNMLVLVKRTIAAQAHDHTPTRYFLCTKVVIDQLMLSFEVTAMNIYRPESPEGFICLYDTAHGIDRALWVIQGVIRELHQETNYREKLRIDPTGTANPPVFSVTEELNEYMWAQIVVSAIERIAKDPSGFTLLDESVALIHKTFIDVPHADLIIVGAEIGQKIYKALYPLTEGI